MRKLFIIYSVVLTLGIALVSLSWQGALWLYVPLLPLVTLGVQDIRQKKQTIRYNYPVLGRLRYLFELIRPEMQQYFVESDVDGRPISRIERSTVYQRAKEENDTTPFGTQWNVYAEGYEWLSHSIVPIDFHHQNFSPRVMVGNKDCKQPYEASILNVSAMSFGALSPNAVEALNAGANIGKFAHNTGEGGISPYHLKHGGDLIWQVGTGYFGARDEEGKFSPQNFRANALRPEVKMIELKLSQGAKPGHGGILPAKKNTPEIAAIRLVKPNTTVFSPPCHSAFSTPKGLILFISRLRELSDGKPVGFKLCIGRKSEFIAICKAMKELDVYPDFITIDGGEGGTGAAPPEFSNSVGMPMMDAIAFVENVLLGFGIRKHIKIIASGKIFSGFYILRALALGADLCNSARAMMLALGCIQALRCNTNACPTGVATQDKALMKGLNVDNKKMRVANYHKNTVKSFLELMGAAGLDHPSKLKRSHVNRRVFMNEVRTLEEVFPYIPEGSLLDNNIPEKYLEDLKMANADAF